MKAIKLTESEMYTESGQITKHIKGSKYIMITGSITVEASFIIPIVILLVFSLLYLTFYLHDFCRVQGVINQVTHRAALMVKHETDIVTGEINYEEISKRGIFYNLVGNTDEDRKQIESYLHKKLSKGLFLLKVEKLETKLTKRKLIVSVDTNTRISLKVLPGIIDQLDHRIFQLEYQIHNPAETLRLTEVILDTGSKIKGVDALKEKLEKFLHSK